MRKVSQSRSSNARTKFVRASRTSDCSGTGLGCARSGIEINRNKKAEAIYLVIMMKSIAREREPSHFQAIVGFDVHVTWRAGAYSDMVGPICLALSQFTAIPLVTAVVSSSAKD